MQQPPRHALTLFLLILAACGETARPVATSSSQKAPAPSPTPTPEPHHKVSEQLGIPGTDGTGVGGPIAPSMQQRGTQAYVVPKSTHLFYWLYEPDSGTQAIWDIHV